MISDVTDAAYWRNNEIEGLRAELETILDPPADPEEKERRERVRARLKTLQDGLHIPAHRSVDL